MYCSTPPRPTNRQTARALAGWRPEDTERGHSTHTPRALGDLFQAKQSKPSQLKLRSKSVGRPSTKEVKPDIRWKAYYILLPDNDPTPAQLQGEVGVPCGGEAGQVQGRAGGLLPVRGAALPAAAAPRSGQPRHEVATPLSVAPSHHLYLGDHPGADQTSLPVHEENQCSCPMIMLTRSMSGRI